MDRRKLRPSRPAKTLSRVPVATLAGVNIRSRAAAKSRSRRVLRYLRLRTPRDARPLPGMRDGCSGKGGILHFTSSAIFAVVTISKSGVLQEEVYLRLQPSKSL